MLFQGCALAHPWANLSGNNVTLDKGKTTLANSFSKGLTNRNVKSGLGGKYTKSIHEKTRAEKLDTN